MRKEYLEPFIKASETISKEYLGLKVIKSKTTMEKTLYLEKDVIIYLGIRGDLKGLVLFGLNQNEAVNMANHVLALYDVPKREGWDEMTMGVWQEFGNQVVGRVTQLYGDALDEGGKTKDVFHCNITTPKFRTSDELKAFTYDCVRLEITTEIGAIVTKLYIQKK